MSIYFFISLLLLSPIIADIYSYKKNSKLYRIDMYNYNRIIFSIVVIITLWIMTSFRSINIGNDTITYCKYFRVISSSGINTNYAIEIGYQYIILFISKITKSIHGFIILSSSIQYILLTIYMIKYSKNKEYFAVLVFAICFGAICNIQRQTLAMIICMFAYEQLKKKKYMLFFLFVLLASTIHSSSLCVLLILFNKIMPIKKKKCVIIFILIFLLSVTGRIFGIVNLISGEYNNYFESQYANSGYLGVFIYIIKATFIYMIARINSSRKIEYTNAFLLISFSLCAFSVNLFTRISDYFLWLSLVDITNIDNFSDFNRQIKLLDCFIFFSVVWFFVIILLRPEWNNLVPYEFWH